MSYKIKKNGLLWKLHQEFYSEVYQKLLIGEPVGLCLFFWNTLWQMLKGLVAGIMVLLVVIALLLGAYLVLSWVVGLVALSLFGVFLPYINYEWVYLCTILVLGAGYFFICVEGFLKAIGSNSGTMKVAPEYMTKIMPKSSTKKAKQVAKQESLVISYWRAFKGKVCPIIEVE